MTYVFLLLFLASIVGLIWGLVAPKHFSKSTNLKKLNGRKHISLTFGVLILLFFVLTGLTAPKQDQANNLNNTKPTSTKIAQKPTSQKPVITTKTVTTTSSVAFTVKSENDSSLNKGQTKVTQTGKNGIETSTYLVTYSNGKETSKKLESQSVTTQPVQQITEVGTYVAPTYSNTANSYTSASSNTSTAPTGCYPLSDENTCYEPGEYCRDDNHGQTGVDGDGGSIICEDNDGWRWEPN